MIDEFVLSLRAPSEEDNFFAAIGRLTVSWAYIELGLDLSLKTVYHDLGAKLEREPPHALDRRLRYLVRAFKTVDALADFRARGLRVCGFIAEAKERRHDIIHGCVVTERHANGNIGMFRLLRERDTHRVKAFVVSAAAVLGAALEADRIAGHALRLGEDLHASFSRM